MFKINTTINAPLCTDSWRLVSSILHHLTITKSQWSASLKHKQKQHKKTNENLQIVAF